MIQWRFFLDDVEYDEPDNFSDLLLMIKRDELYHGVFFEASISSLTFSGAAADKIIEKDRTEGFLAQVVFRAEFNCESEWEELIRGTLNMGKMRRRCGTGCSVVIPIEQTNCTMLLRNRFDQKVDMDSLVAFDKFTALEDYEYAGFDITMPSKALQVSAEGTVDEDGDKVMFDTLPDEFFASTYVRPTYEKSISESITTTQLTPTIWIAGANPIADQVVSPIILLEETIDCFDGQFSYNIRLKGSIYANSVFFVRLRIMKGLLPETEDPLGFNPDNGPEDGFIILNDDLLTVTDDPETGTTLDGTFDETRTGSTTLNNGEGIWVYLLVRQQSRAASFGAFVEFDEETAVNIQAIKECPDTTARVYAVNEALSRVTEAITNACLKVRSDYYGRTDSRPYASTEDGCGGLRVVNSGLQLRNAVDAKMFLSLKDAFEGLNPIDNIGFGIEPDPDRVGFDQLRVEPVEHWYQENEILALPLAVDVNENAVETEAYATIKNGYQKWEVEAVNGLDEINAKREFRTALTTINNALVIESKMVAGGYPIEITRQQSYAETGAADTTYDNEAFIYCVQRALYGFQIEQGGVTGATGMFSPTTLYNWRIRPFYNLMRWFKTIAVSYPTVGDTEKKVFFTAGTGNYRAAGEITTGCKLENGVKAENQDLGKDDFIDGSFQPLWRAKEIVFKYPISIAQYKQIKANPYGYISVQCGTGEWLKGYINSIQYDPYKGEAEFNLKRKWQL